MNASASTTDGRSVSAAWKAGNIKNLGDSPQVEGQREIRTYFFSALPPAGNAAFAA
jgi:hypothetical protein